LTRLLVAIAGAEEGSFYAVMASNSAITILMETGGRLPTTQSALEPRRSDNTRQAPPGSGG